VSSKCVCKDRERRREGRSVGWESGFWIWGIGRRTVFLFISTPYLTTPCSRLSSSTTFKKYFQTSSSERRFFNWFINGFCRWLMSSTCVRNDRERRRDGRSVGWDSGGEVLDFMGQAPSVMCQVASGKC